jgi:PAS domain S-box-containing protein
MPVANIPARMLTDLLFEDAVVGRCLVTPDGTVLRANAEWLRSTGFTEDQVVGADIIDLFPETRDMALATHARVRAGHRVEVPRHAQTVNGRETWWEGSIEPVAMEGGTGLLITAREVTATLGIVADGGCWPDQQRALDALSPAMKPAFMRKRAEQALREADERLRTIFDISADAIGVSQDGVHVLANRAYVELFGYSSLAEIVGRPITDLIAPSERQMVIENVRRRSSGGVAPLNYETRGLKKDGTEFDMDVRVSMYQGGDGTYVVVILRDISERNRAEEALRESEERLRAAFAASPDAITINRLRDGVYVSVNDGFVRLSGRSAVEALGTTAELDVWVDTAERARLMERLLGGEPVQNAETTFRRKDGTVFTASISARTFTARGERFLLSITRDVTDRKNAELALEKANALLRDVDRRKDKFLAMLSHELRNPLAPIRNSTYILQHVVPGGEQARRARDVIERQTEHLTRLVDDLLDVTRIARGKIELRCTRVDLREVVLRAADDFRALMEDRGIVFSSALGSSPVWVDADPTRLTQVIGNLLHNAGKFSGRGGSVMLSLREDGGEAEISVRDTGVGIEPAVLPRLFEAFVQADQTLARAEGGLGLGLALVKGITELHGGTVRAESAGKGKGAEFVVRLPLARLTAIPVVVPQRARRPAAKRCRVLVVDDNADAADSLAEIVELLGHTADVAYDGPTAVEKALATRPDVVLCDIGLPGMSGYEVAQALRAMGKNGTRLVALTGYAQPEDVKRATEAGFDGHVAKPCDVEQIELLLA